MCLNVLDYCPYLKFRKFNMKMYVFASSEKSGDLSSLGPTHPSGGWLDGAAAGASGAPSPTWPGRLLPLHAPRLGSRSLDETFQGTLS